MQVITYLTFNADEYKLGPVLEWHRYCMYYSYIKVIEEDGVTRHVATLSLPDSEWDKLTENRLAEANQKLATGHKK